jgi:hypothetical protein
MAKGWTLMKTGQKVHTRKQNELDAMDSSKQPQGAECTEVALSAIQRVHVL